MPALAEEKSKSTVAPALRVIAPTARVVLLPPFGSIVSVLTVPAVRLSPVTVCVVLPDDAPTSLKVPPPSTTEEAVLREPPLAALRTSVPALTVVAPV